MSGEVVKEELSRPRPVVAGDWDGEYVMVDGDAKEAPE